ncbi:MAG: hypothetical protein OHK93_005789 [Ramalina farinacea]|uniref:Uncharacterized protein n=1 Tax=Ramalina farinacea TaxID=258253 RepID=A0AA43TSE6_9LECA|nr:hypothetical protein [Ramalina farinacea]
MATKTLFILYNADASIMGKLKYSYRKLTTSKDCTPACAACDITHGGLHLDETSDWKRVKGEVAAKTEEGGAGYDVVMDKEELATFGGSADRFLEGLQKKRVLSASSSASSL